MCVCGGAVGRPGPCVLMRSTALVMFRGTLGLVCLTCPSGWVSVAFPPFRSKAYYRYYGVQMTSSTCQNFRKDGKSQGARDGTQATREHGGWEGGWERSGSSGG